MTALILLSEFQKTEIELWRPIARRPDYEISTLGRLRSFRRDKAGRVRDSEINRHGYRQFVFTRNNQRQAVLVHRMVARAFLPNPLNLPEVNHKTFVKADCRLGNLEWMTRGDNVRHAARYLPPTEVRGSKHGRSKLKESDVLSIRKKRSNGERSQDIASQFGICKSTVNQVVARKIWTHI